MFCGDLSVQRLILQGLLSVLSFGCVQNSVREVYGKDVSCAFVVLTMLQFHLPFYISRMLPNSFALILTNVAMADWIRDPSNKRIIYILTFAMVTTLSAVCRG